MKKYVLGIIAIVLAVGFSAFTTAKKVPVNKKFMDTYWFRVSSNISSGAVASSDVVYLGQSTDNDEPDGTPLCTDNNNYCVIYFDGTSKLQPVGASSFTIDGSQTPDHVFSRKQ